MENIDTDPLYKIFCIGLIYLIPLLPAFLLYKIAPKDKFFSTGNFSGFKINATGASAIYIVLFTAFYAKVNTIIGNIDTVKALQQKFDNTPWRVECNIKLMQDATHELNGLQYEKIINQDSIFCLPRSFQCDNRTKQISFYVENEVVENSKGKIPGMLVINNGFGSATFETNPKELDRENRIIKISSVLTRQLKSNYLHQSDNKTEIPIINKADGLMRAPVPKL